VYHLGLRFGMYTDDTNSTLALATSLIEKKGLDPEYTARKYAEFWRDTVPKRGYPGSAQAVMNSILKGEDYKKTGSLCFEDGSFANVGAMRIAPVGLTFRNATDEQLYEAVRLAIISSHIHPQAIDGAFIQAKAVSMMLKQDPKHFDPMQFLTTLHACTKTPEMKQKIELILKNLPLVESEKDTDLSVVLRQLQDDAFQIKAVDAMAVALWAVVRFYKDPEEALIKVISFGGDTDTTGAICGAMLGSLHGANWIPSRWYDNLEKGCRGRDFAIRSAKQLMTLDLFVPL